MQSQLTLTIPLPDTNNPFSIRAQLMRNATPITKLSLPLWIDPNTGQMIEQNANLAILADTISPAQLPTGSNTTFGFTIVNLGPGLAQDLETTLTLPSGLSATSTASTLGTTQITSSNTVRLSINQLAYEESASFSVTANNINAQGLLTTTTVVTSSTTDPDSSNNTASITGTFTAAPTPTPTPHLHRPPPYTRANSPDSKPACKGRRCSNKTDPGPRISRSSYCPNTLVINSRHLRTTKCQRHLARVSRRLQSTNCHALSLDGFSKAYPDFKPTLIRH